MLNIDPKIYQAIIYGGLAEGWQSTVANPQIMKASNEIKRAIKIIREKYEGDTEFADTCISYVQEMASLAKAMFKLYEDYNLDQKVEYRRLMNLSNDAENESKGYYYSYDAMAMAQQRAVEYKNRAYNVDNKRVYTYNSGCEAVCYALNNVIIDILNSVNDSADLSNKFLEEIKKSAGVCDGFLTTDGCVKQYNSIINYAADAVKAKTLREEEKRKKFIERYWASHPEELSEITNASKILGEQLDELKKLVEEEQTRINHEVAKLKSKKSIKLPSEKAVDDQKRVISVLKNKLEETSFFKFKEKKTLRERIETQETPKLNQLIQIAKDERAKYNRDIDKEIQEVEKSEEIIKNKGAIAEIAKKAEEYTKLIETRPFEQSSNEEDDRGEQS